MNTCIATSSECQIIWDNESLAEALSIPINIDFSAYGISIDSRTLQEGDIFIALKGPKFDGNEFISEALNKGASLVLSHYPHSDQRVIKVENTFATLNLMAKFARARLKGKLIGITGSVGKTSTKEMLKLALQNQGKVFANEGSYNNHIGLPLSLARMPEDTDYAIIEMGMNHQRELHQLTMVAIPDIAIITNVEAVHLEFFTSISAIADAKSEIFDSMREGAFAIINIDNPYHKILTTKAEGKKLNIVGFSANHNTPVKLINYKFDHISVIEAEIFGKRITYSINSGKHLVMNSLAVLAAVKIAGAELDYAVHNLKSFKSLRGRGEVHHLAGITIIDESYNASPVAVKAALDNLCGMRSKGRLIAILGNMSELGRDSEHLHIQLLNHITQSHINKVFTVGHLMYALYNKLPKELQGIHTDDADKMAEQIRDLIKPHDIILIKGGRIMQMEKIFQALQDYK